MVFFFFKQKSAYDMCGRDWSSDVCSSDLAGFINIKYTTDGTDPTVDSESATDGMIPCDNSFEIRAAAFDDELYPNFVTSTVYFRPNVSCSSSSTVWSC